MPHVEYALKTLPRLAEAIGLVWPEAYVRYALDEEYATLARMERSLSGGSLARHEDGQMKYSIRVSKEEIAERRDRVMRDGNAFLEWLSLPDDQRAKHMRGVHDRMPFANAIAFDLPHFSIERVMKGLEIYVERQGITVIVYDGCASAHSGAIQIAHYDGARAYVDVLPGHPDYDMARRLAQIMES